MTATSVRVRPADLSGEDAVFVGAAVRDYLVQTEVEKAAEGVPGASGSLPERYLPEVEDPCTAYAGHEVLVAEVDGAAAGVVVRNPGDAVSEIKRLWAAPEFRGRGVGSALLDAAIADSAGDVRLTVWEWRAAAIGLYESRGFARVESGDHRERLLCFVRSRA